MIGPRPHPHVQLLINTPCGREQLLGGGDGELLEDRNVSFYGQRATTEELSALLRAGDGSVQHNARSWWGGNYDDTRGRCGYIRKYAAGGYLWDFWIRKWTKKLFCWLHKKKFFLTSFFEFITIRCTLLELGQTSCFALLLLNLTNLIYGNFFSIALCELFSLKTMSGFIPTKNYTNLIVLKHKLDTVFIDSNSFVYCIWTLFLF